VHGGATCSFQANQGISYLIESEENRTGDGGQLCLRSAAPLLHVAMSGVERRGRQLSWETTSESGTLGFVVEHDAGSGFVAVSTLLPSLSEPGGGVYAYYLPAGLTGALRVVEVEVSGAEDAYEVGGEPVSEWLSVSTAAPFASRAHAPERLARQKTAEPSGPGEVARVLVAREGLVHVSVAALAAAFGVPSARVSAAMTSGSLSLSDGTRALPYEVTAAGDVVFFATAPDHVFSDVRHYFLRLDGGGSSFEVHDATPVEGAEVDSYVHELHLEQETFAGMVVVEDTRSDHWFWQTISPSAPLSTAFTLGAPAVAAAQIEVELHTIPGYDEGATVSLWVDGQPVGAEVPPAGRPRLSFQVDASQLGAGEHTLEVRTSAGFLYVDQLDLRVPTTLGDQGAIFDAASDSIVNLPAGETLRVFDVTDPTAPRLLTGVLTDGGVARFQARAAHRYLIDRGDVSTPESVAGANPTDVTGDLAAEYVVIAHRSLLSAVAPLVQAREADGLSAVVVDVQDIFDAYAAGVADPEAIRTFLLRAHASWSVPPRYVLLAGHGTFDFRDIRGIGDNLVPGPVARTVGGLFASDGYLTSESATSGPLLPVGRLPARSPGELSAMIDRILAYEAREHDALLTVADRPSQGDDFEASAALAAGQAPAGIELRSVAQTGAVADARDALRTALQQSPDTVFYFGHGGLDRVGRDGILRIQDLPSLAAEGQPALHVTLSCSVGRFDVPGFESLSEELLRLPQGAVAVFGPSGQTNLGDADILAGPVVGQLFRDNARLGDATLAAIQELGGEYDAARLFNLLGDPAMRTGAVVEPEPPSGGGGGSGVIVPLSCSASGSGARDPLALHGLWLLGLVVAARRWGVRRRR